MSIVKIKDKTFRISIPREEILKNVDAVAEKINRDMAGKNPLFLAEAGLLSGCHVDG